MPVFFTNSRSSLLASKQPPPTYSTGLRACRHAVVQNIVFVNTFDTFMNIVSSVICLRGNQCNFCRQWFWYHLQAWALESGCIQLTCKCSQLPSSWSVLHSKCDQNRPRASNGAMARGNWCIEKLQLTLKETLQVTLQLQLHTDRHQMVMGCDACSTQNWVLHMFTAAKQREVEQGNLLPLLTTAATELNVRRALTP